MLSPDGTGSIHPLPPIYRQHRVPILDSSSRCPINPPASKTLFQKHSKCMLSGASLARHMKIVRDGPKVPSLSRVRKQRKCRKKWGRRLHTPKKERWQQWKRSLRRSIRKSWAGFECRKSGRRDGWQDGWWRGCQCALRPRRGEREWMRIKSLWQCVSNILYQPLTSMPLFSFYVHSCRAHSQSVVPTAHDQRTRRMGDTLRPNFPCVCALWGGAQGVSNVSFWKNASSCEGDSRFSQMYL